MPLYHLLCHRDNFPKDKEEYSNDDNNDSHKCGDSTGQQSVKCECLLDDEESDYTQNSPSEKYIEQNQLEDCEQMVVEDNQGNKGKCSIKYLTMLL